MHGDAVMVRGLVRTEDGGWEPSGMSMRVELKDLIAVDESPQSTNRHRARKGGLEHRIVKFAVLETRDATETTPADGWFLVNDYTQTDTYGTRFALGGCKKYLDAHPYRPTLLYGHGAQGGIHSVLGHGVAWRESPQGLAIKFEFDDFDVVPTSHQAFVQLRSKTFDSFSIGFIRHADHYDEDLDCTVIDEYDLPEVSIVIEASNAGTGILSLSGARMTQQDRATQILINLDAGGVDLGDAIVEMRDVFIEPRAGVVDAETVDEVDCPTCDGTGTVDAKPCPDCDGTGKVDPSTVEERAEMTECSTCNGTGTIKLGKVKCPDCNGAGKVAVEIGPRSVDAETAELLSMMEIG